MEIGHSDEKYLSSWRESRQPSDDEPNGDLNQSSGVLLGGKGRNKNARWDVQSRSIKRVDGLSPFAYAFLPYLGLSWDIQDARQRGRWYLNRSRFA